MDHQKWMQKAEHYTLIDFPCPVFTFPSPIFRFTESAKRGKQWIKISYRTAHAGCDDEVKEKRMTRIKQCPFLIEWLKWFLDQFLRSWIPRFLFLLIGRKCRKKFTRIRCWKEWGEFTELLCCDAICSGLPLHTMAFITKTLFFHQHYFRSSLYDHVWRSI